MMCLTGMLSSKDLYLCDITEKEVKFGYMKVIMKMIMIMIMIMKVLMIMIMTKGVVIEDASIGDVGGGGEAADYIGQHVPRWTHLGGMVRKS